MQLLKGEMKALMHSLSFVHSFPPSWFCFCNALCHMLALGLQTWSFTYLSLIKVMFLI